jgi:tetratricopeptide (TPR) repeat protein
MVEIGRTHVMLGCAREATRWFERAIAVDEHCHEPFAELSLLRAQAGELDTACDFLRRATELRPTFPDYRYQLGTLLLDLGRVDDAIGQFEEALILHPDHGHCALLLASAYALVGCRRQARELVHSGAWREWSEAMLLDAEMLAQDGRAADAREVLARLLEREPGHADAEAARAALLA